ncbi:MAG: hypothetical protein VX529_06450 [Pseudomonadota bacterium]|nr:hypothetical protein [Pseudomonadota bacterium]
MNTDDMPIQEIRARAYADFSGVDIEDVCEEREETRFESLQHGNASARVLTDEEADKACKESIADSLWAFNPSFLASFTGLPEEAFQAIADNGRCESNNEAIRAMIDGTGNFDQFVQEAVSADGRGHFLAGYDGNETEHEFIGRTFYIYQD